MKLLGILLTAFLMIGHASQVFADSELEQNMKEIGARFEFIGKNFTDASQVNTLIAATSELRLFVNKATVLVPSKINTFPEADRAAALLKYQKLSAQLFIAGIDLEEAFRAGSTDKAKAQLDLMAKLRKEAHVIFK